MFDRVNSLSTSYSKILAYYGKPNMYYKNGDYIVLLYTFNGKRKSKFLPDEDFAYYKFLFYNKKLIKVKITLGGD